MNVQTLSEFQNEKKKELISFCQQTWDFSDIQQTQAHIAAAGRLAFLEEFQPLCDLETIFREQNLLPSFEEFLSSLFKDWWMDWAGFEGETLGKNILFLQDFQAVLTCSEIPFSNTLKVQFEQLVNSIGTPILDTEAKIALDEFNLFYPMPKEKRLPVLREPISRTMFQIEQILRPDSDKVWDTIWNSQNHCWEIQTANGKKLLSLQWTQQEPPVFKVLNSREKPVDFISIMRIGTHPVTQNAVTPELWNAECRWLSVKPETIRKKGLTVRFADGSRAVFPVGEHSFEKYYSKNSFFEKIKQGRQIVMSAETSTKTEWTSCYYNVCSTLIINVIADNIEICFSEYVNQTGKTFSKIRIFGHEIQATEDGFWSVPIDEFCSWIGERTTLEVVSDDGTLIELKLQQADE